MLLALNQQASFPGPSISFAHLFCPLCGAAQARAGGAQLATLAVHLDHPMLQNELQPELALRDSVVSLARHRLKLEGAAAFPELQPGGSFEGRAVDLALTRFAFYKCSKW
ncbi:IBR domain-containing protein, partial [Haematococcus lacustris]